MGASAKWATNFPIERVQALQTDESDFSDPLRRVTSHLPTPTPNFPPTTQPIRSQSISHSLSPTYKIKTMPPHHQAHKNTFAFRHNPKSKLTATIAATPIVGVCEKCRIQIQWRKDYRRYKPLKAPATW